MAQHRARDFPVSAQAFANHVFPIVLAHDERRAIVIAAARDLRAFRKDVEHLAALRALAAAHHASHENVGGHVQMNHDGRRQISRGQQVVEILRLLDGARIAIEHEAAPAVRLLNRESKGGVDQIVGNQSAGGDDGLRRRPSGVPAAISARSISPVEMEGIVRAFPSHSMISRPCVPLPQPGGPKRRIIKDDCIVRLQIDDNKVCQHKMEIRPATADYERRSWRAASAGARCARRC